MKILCIHGVSNEEKDNAFRPRWQAAIDGALGEAGGAGVPEYDYLEYDALREQLRKLLGDHIKASAPDIVCAHSLGSLIAYDTFARTPELVAGRVLMTFGSQIANSAVRGDVFGGRIVPIAACQRGRNALSFSSLLTPWMQRIFIGCLAGEQECSRFSTRRAASKPFSADRGPRAQ